MSYKRKKYPSEHFSTFFSPKSKSKQIWIFQLNFSYQQQLLLLLLIIIIIYLFYFICFVFVGGVLAPEVLTLIRKFTPGPADSSEAMAGDPSTELLFLDTFKHQSAEVVFSNT